MFRRGRKPVQSGADLHPPKRVEKFGSKSYANPRENHSRRSLTPVLDLAARRIGAVFLFGKLRGRRLRRGVDSNVQARAFAFERRKA